MDPNPEIHKLRAQLASQEQDKRIMEQTYQKLCLTITDKIGDIVEQNKKLEDLLNQKEKELDAIAKDKDNQIQLVLKEKDELQIQSQLVLKEKDELQIQSHQVLEEKDELQIQLKLALKQKDELEIQLVKIREVLTGIKEGSPEDPIRMEIAESMGEIIQKMAFIQLENPNMMEIEKEYTSRENLLEIEKNELKAQVEKLMAEKAEELSNRIPWKVYRVLGDHSDGKIVISLLRHLKKNCPSVNSYREQSFFHDRSTISPSALICVKLNTKGNTGNWVRVGEKLIRLSQIPSGIVVPGILCIIGPKCVINLWILMKEIDELVKAGVSNVAERLIISDSCLIVTPKHLKQDMQQAYTEDKTSHLEVDGSKFCQFDSDTEARLRAISLFGMSHDHRAFLSWHLRKEYEKEFTEDFMKSIQITPSKDPIVPMDYAFWSEVADRKWSIENFRHFFEAFKKTPLTVVCEDSQGRYFGFRREITEHRLYCEYSKCIDYGAIMDTFPDINFDLLQNVLVIRAYEVYDGKLQFEHDFSQSLVCRDPVYEIIRKAEQETYPADRPPQIHHLMLGHIANCIVQCTIGKNQPIILFDRIEVLEKAAHKHSDISYYLSPNHANFENTDQIKEVLIQKMIGFGVPPQNIKFSTSHLPDPSIFQ